MMRIGIVVFAIGALVAFVFNTSATATLVGVLIAASGFAGFAVNATVMLWNLAPSQRLIGVYTGIFAVAQADRLVGRARPRSARSSTSPTGACSCCSSAGFSLVGLLLTFGVRREYAPSQVAEEKYVEAERA